VHEVVAERIEGREHSKNSTPRAEQRKMSLSGCVPKREEN